MSLYWINVGPKSSNLCWYKKIRRYIVICTKKSCDVEPEIGMMQLQAKKWQGLLGASRRWRKQRRVFPQSFWKGNGTADTLILDFYSPKVGDIFLLFKATVSNALL